jgi:hypothetical protein
VPLIDSEVIMKINYQNNMFVSGRRTIPSLQQSEYLLRAIAPDCLPLGHECAIGKPIEAWLANKIVTGRYSFSVSPSCPSGFPAISALFPSQILALQTKFSVVVPHPDTLS